MRMDRDIEIRIRPDGRVLFSGLPEELLEMAAAMDPHDASLARRVELLAEVRRGRLQQQTSEEHTHGDAAPGE